MGIRLKTTGIVTNETGLSRDSITFLRVFSTDRIHPIFQKKETIFLKRVKRFSFFEESVFEEFSEYRLSPRRGGIFMIFWSMEEAGMYFAIYSVRN